MDNVLVMTCDGIRQRREIRRQTAVHQPQHEISYRPCTKEIERHPSISCRRVEPVVKRWFQACEGPPSAVSILEEASRAFRSQIAIGDDPGAMSISWSEMNEPVEDRFRR